MSKNKIKPKVKKKVSKKVSAKKILKPFKKKVTKKIVKKELILKTRPEWIKSALANKTQYKKKYSNSIKNNNEFWKKEGKE